MSITNKQTRLQSRWRFWLGYTISLIAVAATVYFSLGASKQAAKSEDTELERLQNRDKYWERMANLATNLNKFRDLSVKSTISTEDEAEKGKLKSQIDTEFTNLNSEFQNNSATMELPDKTLKGLINYYSLMNSFDEKLLEKSTEIKEKEEEKCEDKIRKLERDHDRKVERLEDQIARMGTE